MKYLFLALLLLGLLFRPAKSQAKVKEVQLGCRSPMFAHTFDNPFTAIVSAIKKDKNTLRFRVTWGDRLGSGWDEGTILYDRKRGILKYYDVGGAGEAGEEYYRKSYLFTGVKDGSLIAIVEKYNNKEQIRNLFAFTFLETLPKHGYRKYKLDDYKRGF